MIITMEQATAMNSMQSTLDSIGSITDRLCRLSNDSPSNLKPLSCSAEPITRMGQNARKITEKLKEKGQTNRTAFYHWPPIIISFD